MERKLASIQTIRHLEPAENSDNLAIASVLNWEVLVRNGEFNIGDKIVFFEPDAFLPIRPEFEFLRKSNFKTMRDEVTGENVEGFRIKTIKLRGNLSQGLVFDAKVFGMENYDIDTDVTEELGVKKWELPLPDSQEIEGLFPDFVPKTSCTRFQTLKSHQYAHKLFWMTEKIDGTSGTLAEYNGEFYLASRNFLVKPGANKYSFAVNNYRLYEVIPENTAIQYEVYGPGIQGNPLRVQKLSIAVFSMFDIISQTYWDLGKVAFFCKNNNVPMVPTEMKKQYTLYEQDWMKFVDGQHSSINSEQLLEGFVFHSDDLRIKFISRAYDAKRA